MDLNYTAAKFWLDVGQIIAICCLGIYTWWQGKSRATQSAIERVDKNQSETSKLINDRIESHADRILLVEKRIESLPQDRHISELHEKMNVTNREMGELGSALKSTNSLLNVLHEHLMNKKS